MEVERFLDVNDDGSEYESMDIDVSDTVPLERTHSAGLSRTKALSANPVEYGTLSSRKEEEYLAEQFFSLNLLSEHLVIEYDILSTSLISCSSSRISKNIRCIIPSIIRSNPSLNGYQSTSRSIFYLFE